MDTDTSVRTEATLPMASNRTVGALTEAHASGVAWGAIMGGALVAVATTLILMALGSGLGLASVTPWPYAGASLKAFTAMSAIWLVIVQWLSSGLGGYLTGRMRTKWSGVHDHEVFFRDTANGLLAWALATVACAAVLASVATSLAGGAARGATNVAAGGAAVAASASASSEMRSPNGADPFAYFADSLFRPQGGTSEAAGNGAAPNPSQQQNAPVDSVTRTEAARILINSASTGDVPATDKTYLAQLVSTRTGMSQADAEKRVNDVVGQVNDLETRTRQAADAARKAGAGLAIITALSMLLGAFIAAVAAALGGHHRDEWSARLARL